jgi:uncharacterized glyoxalase superfamily protein PhnB
MAPRVGSATRRAVFPAAGKGKDVRIGGGAFTISQYLKARLVDEQHFVLVPILLGSGERIVEGMDGLSDIYEVADYIPSKTVAHMRIVKRAECGSREISKMLNLECIASFVERLAASKKFCLQISDTDIVYADPGSAALKFENLMINLLKISEAPGLIVPAKVADSSAGRRLMFTVRVPNVDEVCVKLKTLGVQLLNGAQDRPWGRRTAAFADPAGHVWELAHEI